MVGIFAILDMKKIMIENKSKAQGNQQNKPVHLIRNVCETFVRTTKQPRQNNGGGGSIHLCGHFVVRRREIVWGFK